jgi:PKD repeat protein
MRSVEALRRRLRHALRACAAVVVLAGVSSCADGFSPLSSAAAPAALTVTAVRKDAVQLSWARVVSDTVASYVIERRRDLRGPFVEVAQVPQSTLARVLWLDTDVEPETFYGYRVYAVTLVGDRSPPSAVGGARTPSLPGIDVQVVSVVPAAEALDADGYEVIIAGPDSIRAAIGVEARRRFSPLKPGRYSVTLGGLASRCAVDGSGTTQVEVTDSTAVTITPVEYTVRCKDPSRGEISVEVAVTGSDLDDLFSIDVLGQVADTTLPVAERVFSARRDVQRVTPVTVFSNLRPGAYDIRLDSIAPNCALEGEPIRTATVTPLTIASVRYVIACRGTAPPTNSSAPFVWRNRWSPRSAGANARVSLEVALDLSARAGQAVQGVQAELSYDPSVLRYEDAEAGQLARLTANGTSPGAIFFIATASGGPRTGVVTIARFNFTVIGASGAQAITRTQNVRAGSPTAFQDSIRVEEDTLTVGSGTGTTNQPPVAQFTGPTTGVVGTAVSFNGSGSTDPDGTIASYAWTFGDNTTATGVSPSKAYTAAGTYTVTLTVTDNRGATASRTASITITAGGTPPPAGNAPVARANGPYAGQPGVPLTLSSAGSANATSFSWALGNGQTATGASPSVTYATAGTYTITLTATGASGATATSQATATITASPPPSGSGMPLIWRNVVQAYDTRDSTVAVQIVYDMNADIPETPGAEALRSFVLDSLKWDASRLRFLSLNYGPGMRDVATTQPGAASGRLVLRGSTSAGLDGGTLVIATVRFKVIGATGQAVTTSTFLGPLLGTPATNSFSYNSKTQVVEGQFTVP